MIPRAKRIGVKAWFVEPPNPKHMLTLLRDTLARAS